MTIGSVFSFYDLRDNNNGSDIVSLPKSRCGSLLSLFLYRVTIFVIAKFLQLCDISVNPLLMACPNPALDFLIRSWLRMLKHVLALSKVFLGFMALGVMSHTFKFCTSM